MIPWSYIHVTFWRKHCVMNSLVICIINQESVLYVPDNKHITLPSQVQYVISVKVKQVIGIDHDTVCAGVGGTAIRHSTSCAGCRAAACGRAGRHNECCAWWQYHPRQRGPYKWSISILPRSQFYKKQGKLAFSTSCTAVRPHRRLRNDAWRRDS